MKRCSTCQIYRPIEMFNRKRGSEKEARCKKCKSDIHRTWYKDNRTARREQIRVSKKAWYRETSLLIQGLKSVPCADCNQRYHHYVMDFDHVRGTKKFGVATGKARMISRSVILDEIAKCEVVCANCHRVRTWCRRTKEDPGSSNGRTVDSEPTNPGSIPGSGTL